MTKDYSQQRLLLKLEAMNFDEPEAAVPLSERIALETGLDRATVERGIAEYKKFVYVAVAYNIAPLMPPLADKIWRTHITYTHHYWNYMCTEVIEHELHYRRTSELDAREPDVDHRELTEEAYFESFGEAPPAFLHAQFTEKASTQLSTYAPPALLIAVLACAAYVTGGQGVIVVMGAAVLRTLIYSALANLQRPRAASIFLEDDPAADAAREENLAQLGAAMKNFAKSDLLGELRKTTGWNVEKCELAFEEYIRFLHIKSFAAHRVTPSPAIDQIWHLHLTYSEHYWYAICQGVLGQTFHHVPACGRAGEWARYQRQYRQTLATYKAAFREIPNVMIWPLAPQVRQRRALDAALATAAVVMVVAVAIPLANPWMGLVPAVLTGAVAAIAGYLWPVDDAALTRKDFAAPFPENYIISIDTNGCGG